MRIQHNIAAMNSYRNYSNNVAAVNKNLEKLSSGYKINRAGDDAAGLAISEKMRAQITGLEAAQKNVKDGISLVKTAEGAMQEIQDMLNRMDYLATQSANGTYDNEVDRLNLNKEVTALKSEINRIADSANFNGIKLLDGSLDSGASKPASSLLKTFAKDSEGKWLPPAEIAATKGTYITSDFTDVSVTMSAGDTVDVTFEFQNADGSTFKKEIHLTVETTSTPNQFNLVDENGTKMNANPLSGKLTKTDIATAVEKALKEDDSLTKTFTITKSGDGIQFEANAPGKGTQLVGVNASTTSEKAKLTGADGATTTGWVDQEMKVKPDTSTVGEDKTYAFNLADVTVWDGTEKNLEDAIMELDGHKFVFVQPEGTASLSAAQIDTLHKAGIESWVQLATGTAATATEAKALVQEMRTNTGLDIIQCGADGKASETGTYFRIRDDRAGKGINGTGGLTLQIGDTSDKFNQLKVAVGDMHVNAMGKGKTTIDGQTVNVTKTIADIDISSLEGAQESIGVIRNAINYVSGVRGDLGAIQNRLEHTANNLSVMRENIQDAESTIRDTDVAEEMMSYTKNNILVQSAQAMLAQANQIPQGVLQLLG